MENYSMFESPPLKFDSPVRLIELFSGIGAQAKALERLQAKGKLTFEHWVSCEIDKYAVASYNAVHGTDFTVSDISQLTGKELRIDDTEHHTYVMTYSFPCQDLSLAGKQKGMQKGSDTRSGLLWQVERILNECVRFNGQLPQILLMENVPQVHGKKNEADFRNWIESLRKLGYTSKWKDLNAKDFGVPQNRNRCFMVSWLGEFDYEFPKGFELTKTLNDVLEEEVDEKFFLSDKAVSGILEQQESFS